MANKRISELQTAAALDGSELVEVVQGGVNSKTTVQDIVDMAGGGVVQSVTGDGVDNTDPFNPVIDLTSSRTVSSADAIVQGDNLHIIYLDSATPFNLTIDQLLADSQVTLININTGTVTLVDGAGVTSTGDTTIAADEIATILYPTPTTPIIVTGGTVTTVSFTGGIISVATPSTTPDLTPSGTSGGIVYFSSASTWASSALLAANDLMIGGGAGAAPSTTTTGAGILTWLGTPSYTNFLAAITGTSPYWLLASGGAMTGNNTISGNFGFTMTGTFTGGSDVTPIRANYINRNVTQSGPSLQKEADIMTIEGLLTGSGGGNTQKLFALTVKPTQSSSTGYFGWIRGLDPVSSADAFRFGKPQTVPTSTANNFEFLGGTSGATSLTLQVATGSISFSASSAANIVFRSGTGTSNQVDFGFGSTSIFSARAAANISSGRGKVVATDGVNASSTATQMASFASHFEGSFWTGVAEQKQRAHMILEASTGTNGLGWLRTYAGSGFSYATVIQSMNLINGNVGYAVAVPTARVHIAGVGTTTGHTLLLEASDGTDKFTFVDNGDFQVDKTITAGGTTGDRTINKLAGTVNFAAAATSITVTNSLVTANSLVFCTVRTNDTTAVIKNVVPAAGSFVITLSAAATNETSVGFFIVN